MRPNNDSVRSRRIRRRLRRGRPLPPLAHPAPDARHDGRRRSCRRARTVAQQFRLQRTGRRRRSGAHRLSADHGCHRAPGRAWHGLFQGRGTRGAEPGADPRLVAACRGLRRRQGQRRPPAEADPGVDALQQQFPGQGHGLGAHERLRRCRRQAHRHHPLRATRRQAGRGAVLVLDAQHRAAVRPAPVGRGPGHQATGRAARRQRMQPSDHAAAGHAGRARRPQDRRLYRRRALQCAGRTARRRADAALHRRYLAQPSVLRRLHARAGDRQEEGMDAEGRQRHRAGADLCLQEQEGGRAADFEGGRGLSAAAAPR